MNGLIIMPSVSTFLSLFLMFVFKNNVRHMMHKHDNREIKVAKLALMETHIKLYLASVLLPFYCGYIQGIRTINYEHCST